MTNLSSISQPTQKISRQSDPERLVRAAHQFEAVLLNQMLSGLEHAFSTFRKEKTEDASDHYHFLGVQALASSIAARGGIGIADIILRSLRQRDSRDFESPAREQKSLSKFAAERLHLNF